MINTDLNHGGNFDETEIITFNTHQGVTKSFKKLFSKIRDGTNANPLRAGSTTSIDGSITLPANGYFFWHGESEDGSVLNYLKDSKGNIRGSLVDLAEDMVYQIHTDLDASMMVTITSSSNFDPEKNPEDLDEVGGRELQSNIERDFNASPMSTTHNPKNSNDHTQEQLNELSAQKAPYDDSGGNLDIMVVWTLKAECNNSNMSEGCTLTEATHAAMMALLELAVEETNTTFSLSGVETELLLVHAYRHPTYNVHAVIPALQDLQSGKVSGVHSNRDTYGADIVVMIGRAPRYCGMADIGPRKDLMFSVVDYTCATGRFAFGHHSNRPQSRIETRSWTME